MSPRNVGKASKTPDLDALLEARHGGYFCDTGERGSNPETAWLYEALVELAMRVARLEAKVARQEQTIAPKRKIGGIG